MNPAPPKAPSGLENTGAATERAGFLSCSSESLYYVEHRPTGRPRARVLLSSPLPDERTHSHLSWVRWARLLAENGFLVLRFDYSGTGESTGRFEDATLTAWSTEIAAFAGYLGSESPAEGPLLLHGLRLGGLLSAAAFRDGCGDALLTWEPAESGTALLVDAARRQQAANMVQGIVGAAPGPRAVREKLERGERIEINGYTWSPELWSDAQELELERLAHEDDRPALHLSLVRHARAVRVGDEVESAEAGASSITRDAVPISWPPFWVVGQRLVHELDALFDRSLSFIGQVSRASLEESL